MRAKAYYQTKAGKRKKGRLNNASYQARCTSSKKISHSESVDSQPNKFLLFYLRALISTIEARRVSLEEIISMLKDFRQHSIDLRERFEYWYSYTASRPP
jgi:hypothetical protein